MYQRELSMLNLCSKIIQNFKIKWMNKSIKDPTWDQENTFTTNFPNSLLQERNVLKRGTMLRA